MKNNKTCVECGDWCKEWITCPDSLYEGNGPRLKDMALQCREKASAADSEVIREHWYRMMWMAYHAMELQNEVQLALMADGEIIEFEWEDGDDNG